MGLAVTLRADAANARYSVLSLRTHIELTSSPAVNYRWYCDLHLHSFFKALGSRPNVLKFSWLRDDEGSEEILSNSD